MSVLVNLRAVLESATPGPWEDTTVVEAGDAEPAVDGPHGKTRIGLGRVEIHRYSHVDAESECHYNARLIALAPAMAETLLAIEDESQRRNDIGGILPDIRARLAALDAQAGGE